VARRSDPRMGEDASKAGGDVVHQLRYCSLGDGLTKHLIDVFQSGKT